MGDHTAYALIDGAICHQAGPGYRWEPVGDQETDMLLARLTAEGCSGHVASASDPKICGRCGVHIDELRPDAEAGV
tara:strand:- start:14891 stop:15118 length:228 start_codon:yes stop_codon:yes gene_type:complete